MIKFLENMTLTLEDYDSDPQEMAVSRGEVIKARVSRQTQYVVDLLINGFTVYGVPKNSVEVL